MIILGLIVGPAIGMLAGDFFSQNGGSRWLAVTAISLFLIFVLFAPFFVVELKIGLVFGTLLGLLVFFSPLDLSSSERVGDGP